MNVNRVLAAGIGIPGTDVEVENPTGFANLGQVIVQALNIAIGAASVICVAILIFSGYMYITASGDEAKVEKATKSLTYAIVGLAICFISVLLVNFVLSNILTPIDAYLLTTLVA